MSEELDRQMEENQRKAKEANQKALEEMQKQAAAMQEEIMKMQQQAMAAGGMTQEMMQQMMGYQQQAMQAAMSGDILSLYGDEDDEDETEKTEFIEANPQPEGMTKYLGIGSFFVVMREEPVCTLELMGDTEDYVEETDDSWGIDDRDSLIEMLNSLLQGRAYKSYNDTYLAIKSGNTDDVDEEDLENYQTAMEVLHDAVDLPIKEINKCPSILGWDLERAGYLARVGAHVGYITKEEAWECLKAAATVAKENFADWTQYAISIVMGRAVHMGYHEAYIFAMQDLLIENPEFLEEYPLQDM